jgi:glycosyltransferase involved in cell wall biosynthesis
VIAPIYHQTTVVEALARLPSDVVVLMTRHLAREAEVAAVRHRARDLSVEDRVRIVDPIDDADMPDLYRLADVVVSVAASDGGPITILEAMASGRPIVATDLPSIREWLLEIDPKGLVPVGDSVATARAIARALDRTVNERAVLARRERAAVELGADRNAAFAAAESIHRKVTIRRARTPD